MECVECGLPGVEPCACCYSVWYCSDACRLKHADRHNAVLRGDGTMMFAGAMYEVRTSPQDNAHDVTNVYFPGALEGFCTLIMRRARDSSTFEITDFFFEPDPTRRPHAALPRGWLGMGILCRIARSHRLDNPVMVVVDDWTTVHSFEGVQSTVTRLQATGVETDHLFDVDERLTSDGLAFFCGLAADAYAAVRQNTVLFKFLDKYRAHKTCGAVAEHGYYGQFGFVREGEILKMVPWVCGPELEMADASARHANAAFQLSDDIIEKIGAGVNVEEREMGYGIKVRCRSSTDFEFSISWPREDDPSYYDDVVVETKDRITFHISAFFYTSRPDTLSVEGAMATIEMLAEQLELNDVMLTLTLSDSWKSTIQLDIPEWRMLSNKTVELGGDPGLVNVKVHGKWINANRLFGVSYSRAVLNSTGLMYYCAMTRLNFDELAALPGRATKALVGYLTRMRKHHRVEAIKAAGYYGQFGFAGATDKKSKILMPYFSTEIRFQDGKTFAISEKDVVVLNDLKRPGPVKKSFRYEISAGLQGGVTIRKDMLGHSEKYTIELLFRRKGNSKFERTADVVITTYDMSTFKLGNFFYGTRDADQIQDLPGGLGNFGFAVTFALVRMLHTIYSAEQPFQLNLDDGWRTRLAISLEERMKIDDVFEIVKGDELEFVVNYHFESTFNMFEAGYGSFRLNSIGLRYFCAITDDAFQRYQSVADTELLQKLFTILQGYRDAPSRKAVVQCGYYGKYAFFKTESDTVEKRFGANGDSITHPEQKTPTRAPKRLASPLFGPQPSFIRTEDTAGAYPDTPPFETLELNDGEVSDESLESDGEVLDKSLESNGLDADFFFERTRDTDSRSIRNISNDGSVRCGEDNVPALEKWEPASTSTPRKKIDVKCRNTVISSDYADGLELVINGFDHRIFKFQINAGPTLVSVTATNVCESLYLAFALPRKGSNILSDDVVIVTDFTNFKIRSLFTENRGVADVEVQEEQTIGTMVFDMIFDMIFIISNMRQNQTSFKITILDYWHTRHVLTEDQVFLFVDYFEAKKARFDSSYFFTLFEQPIHGEYYLNSKGLRMFMGLTSETMRDLGTIGPATFIGFITKYRESEVAEAVKNNGYFGQFLFKTKGENEVVIGDTEVKRIIGAAAASDGEEADGAAAAADGGKAEGAASGLNVSIESNDSVISIPAIDKRHYKWEFMNLTGIFDGAFDTPHVPYSLDESDEAEIYVYESLSESSKEEEIYSKSAGPAGSAPVEKQPASADRAPAEDESSSDESFEVICDDSD
jgi:hypothetical protein